MTTSSELKLSLKYKEQPPSSELPLKLGEKSDGSDSDNPPKPRPKLPNFSSCLYVGSRKAKTTSNCQGLKELNSKTVRNEAAIKARASHEVVKCERAKTVDFEHVESCFKVNADLSRQISKCQKVKSKALFSVDKCNHAVTLSAKNIEKCSKIDVQVARNIAACKVLNTKQARVVSHCLNARVKSNISIGNSIDATVQLAVPVPCRYYPIPEPPQPQPDGGACRIRPPSSELPLRLGKKSEIPSNQLPLNLACWHDVPSLQIPIRDTYMIHTNFTADIGGIEVDPLSFSISTDMKSYCWRGSVCISPDDFSRIESKLNTDVGDEVLVNININDHKFSIIAEDVSRTRTFEMHTHNIEGRSITAQLGSDYIKADDKLFDQDNYAQQIVNQQLQNIPFTIDNWEIDDWFIPAESYAVSNKTPIAVIADIAEAAGGYIESHHHEPKLSIKKRWKTRAWEIDKATPDITIPYHVIIHSEDRTNQNPRYNTVMLVGDKDGFNVYRKAEGRDMSAPTLNSPLYTDKNVAIPSSIAILSESGKHRDYQLTMPWTDEIPLSELGQLIQVDDMGESWRGIITAIEVSGKRENKALKPYQLITVDRYMDK